MKLLGAIILLLVCMQNVLSQRKYIDSLLYIIPTQKANSAEQINSYAELSYRYYQINTDSTLFYANKVLELSELAKYKIGISMAYNRQGIAYQAKGDLYKAVVLYLDAIKIAESESNERWLSSALNNLGYVYRQLGDFAKSKELAVKSYTLSVKNNNKRAQAINLTNLAWLCQASGEPQQGLVYAKQAIQLASDIKDDYHMAIGHHVAGKIYLLKRHTDSAKIEFTHGLAAATRSGIMIQQAFNLVGLGKTQEQLKAWQQAVPLLEKGYYLGLQVNALEVQEEALNALITAYQKLNQSGKELLAYQKYIVVKDSLFNVNKQLVITRAQMDYDSEKRKNELLLNQQELAAQKQLSYFLLILAFLLSSTLYIIYRKNRTVSEKNKLLKVAYNDLELQKSALIKQSEYLTGNNKLRDRLFSILAHDLRSPMASLQQVIEHLEYLSKEETAAAKKILLERFSSIDSTLSSLLQWSRDQIAGTNAKSQVGLHKAAQSVLELLEPLAASKKITIQNSCDLQNQVFAVEQHVQILLRNLVSNAVKFSFPNSKVNIHCEQEGDFTKVLVSDTGTGLTEEQLQKLFSPSTHFSSKGTAKETGVGLGLLLCKEIVEQYNGSIGVHPNTPQGLVVYFSLPTRPE